MAETNRRFLLRERPSGRVEGSTFELVEEEIPEISDGEALIKTEWISVDPTNRTWMNEQATYLPPVPLGDPVRASGLGRVVASRSPDYEEGSLVRGFTNWQEYSVASAENRMGKVHEIPGVESASSYMGLLGMTGLTAWVGTTQIGEPAEGETFVVSAAAGAVGSVAGQLAKLRGARVVGIAGGERKGEIVTGKLGFDAAVDHKAENWREQLAEATPDGIDVDFENVGGEIMEAIIARINLHARIALCGLISNYNAEQPPPGPRSFGNLLVKRGMVKGFIVLDHYHQAKEAGTELAEHLAAGRIVELETIVEGFERLPEALNMLFDGENTGKLSVRVG